MKQIIISSAIITVILITVSCITTPVCVTSSITPLQGKIITENLGKTEGSHDAIAILGLFMVGKPELDLAIKQAVQAKGGDTLINVRCYETWSWFILFSSTTVTVQGEAVKLGSDESEIKDRQKTKGKKK